MRTDGPNLEMTRLLTDDETTQLMSLFHFARQTAIAAGIPLDSVALAAMNAGGAWMVEARGSVVFACQCLENTASQQLKNHHDLAAAEVAALATEGNA